MPSPNVFAPKRRRAAFTLLETMAAITIFIIGGLGIIEMLGLINNRATLDRALTAARLLVSAKIAKAQTDVYTPSNKVIPTGCTQEADTMADKDPNDAFDFAGDTNTVKVVNAPEAGTVGITGTMYHYVSTYEAASGSLLITYTLNFTYRGKVYTVSQSTIRTPDLL